MGSEDTPSGQRVDLHLPLTGPNEPIALGTRLALVLGEKGSPLPPTPCPGPPWSAQGWDHDTFWVTSEVTTFTIQPNLRGVLDRTCCGAWRVCIVSSWGHLESPLGHMLPRAGRRHAGWAVFVSRLRLADTHLWATSTGRSVAPGHRPPSLTST